MVLTFDAARFEVQCVWGIARFSPRLFAGLTVVLSCDFGKLAPTLPFFGAVAATGIVAMRGMVPRGYEASPVWVTRLAVKVSCHQRSKTSRGTRHSPFRL